MTREPRLRPLAAACSLPLETGSSSPVEDRDDLAQALIAVAKALDEFGNTMDRLVEDFRIFAERERSARQSQRQVQRFK